MFKNMTIGRKIFFGFSSVLALLLIVGIASYNGLTTASGGFAGYREMARDSNLAALLNDEMLMLRMNVKDFIITGDETEHRQFEADLKTLNGLLETSKNEIQDPERARKVAFVAQAVTEYEAGFDQVAELMKQRHHMVNNILNVNGPRIENTLTSIMRSAYQDQDNEAGMNAGTALRNLLLGRLYVMKFLETNARTDADRVTAELAEFSTELDKLDGQLQNGKRSALLETLKNDAQEYHAVFKELVTVILERNEIITGTLDRIGPEIAQAVKEVKLDIMAVQDKLGPELVASNTLSLRVVGGTSGIALLMGGMLAFLITGGITRSVRQVIDGISEGAAQVASASGQVSATSQSMAEGASEQAASIEETSSSMEEMASMTRQNAENAGNADGLMKDTNHVIESASHSMLQLTRSMDEISKASEETSKIIKTIDEIAFQTNLLALNAAVEAARAGEAGAGFAVVADEVRNLAMRAAQAAKNTAQLIEGTVKKVNDGSQLVSDTSDTFGKVAESARKVGTLVAEITQASREQSSGIEQVNIAISEMDKVVQQNAASAEESASASEQMNAQALQLNEYVAELTRMVSGQAVGVSTGYRLEGSRRARPDRALPPVSRKGISWNRQKKKTAGPGEVRPDQMIPFDDDEDFKNF